MTYYLVLLDDLRSEALALLGEEPVDSLILLLAIDLSETVADRGELRLSGAEEFPVTIVSESHKYTAVALRSLL